MKIVIAPDSFKGSLSARELTSSIADGIRRVYPDAEIVEMPLADGGEGTMENMVYSSGGTAYTREVRGPLGRSVKAAYGVLGDNRTCVIEMAQASGLPLLKEEERNPLITSSYGTGELIRYGLDEGFRHFIIGLGGSATNDAGAGMLRALGVKFIDVQGEILPEGGEALAKLALFDETQLDSRLKDSTIIVASDVTNPLCGPTGASAVFGPQKGATAEMVETLDRALLHFAEVVARQKQKDILNCPGSGAAGGMGGALMAFLDAEMRPGIEIVMEAIRFEESIRDADLVITGEGKLDTQTLSGKVIAGVSMVTGRHSVPTIALCGGRELEGYQLEQMGVMAAFSIIPHPCSLQEAMLRTGEWAASQTEQIMRIIKAKI